MNQELREEVFAYLDMLRESGVTNMFGAPAYVIDEFDLSRQESKAIVSEWMRSKSEQK